MDEGSSKKVEKSALNKLEGMLLRIKYVDYDFNYDDTNISWDGTIDLYHGNIDDKGNFDASIRTQIKGRTTNVKRLQDKRNFSISKKDLENYLKEKGTMFFLVLFKDFDNYKIYYASLLPYNLRNYLKERTNKSGEIPIKLKEVKNCNELQKILRNFYLDKNEQEKISDKVFNMSAFCNNEGEKIVFHSYGINSPEDLLDEDKYIYNKDKFDNIVGISYGVLSRIGFDNKVIIKNKRGKVYYDELKHIKGKNVDKYIFGKYFEMDDVNRIFNIKIKGTLEERVKQVEFVSDLVKYQGFYINDVFLDLKVTMKEAEGCLFHKDNYIKIKKFFKKYKIKKDINLDDWTYKEYNDLLTWIDAIEEKNPVKIKNWNCNTIGVIKIKEILLGVYAIKQKDESFIVYSIWNDNNIPDFLTNFNDGLENIKINNLFSILNSDLYLSSNLDIKLMKNFFKNHILIKNEENIINLQALEVIKAYDNTHNKELLNYALFLLDLIKDYKEVEDIVFINNMQIKKRINKLSKKDINKLISIRDKYDDSYYKISINILIDNLEEAKILYNKLNKEQKEIYNDYPIMKFMK